MGAVCAFLNSQSVPAYLLQTSKNNDSVKACYLNPLGFITQDVLVPIAEAICFFYLYFDQNSLRTEINSIERNGCYLSADKMKQKFVDLIALQMRKCVCVRQFLQFF